MNDGSWYMAFRESMEQLKVESVLHIITKMEELDGKENEPGGSSILDEIALDIDRLTLTPKEMDGIAKWFAPKDGEVPRFVRAKLRRKWRLHKNRISRATSEGFGNYLKKLRNERGYSLKDLERMTAISPSYINRLEKGERKAPTYPIIVKLAQALGVDTSGFLVTAGLDKTMNGPIPDFMQLVYGNDFMIGGKIADKQIKDVLYELISAIVESKWDAKSRNQEMAILIDHVDELKEMLT
jgi:transcriptional regulator with XRE-family HTH domain